jgi:hypothetical protein
MSSQTANTKLSAAARIVEAIEKQVARTTDPHVKRLLLASGCQVIEHVLKQHKAA